MTALQTLATLGYHLVLIEGRPARLLVGSEDKVITSANGETTQRIYAQGDCLECAAVAVLRWLNSGAVAAPVTPHDTTAA